MRIEARETARLYQVLSDKLGTDTTEAMFKYIDVKTENTVDASIKIVATKDELFSVKDELNKSLLATRDDLNKSISSVRNELFSVRDELNRSISSVRNELFPVRDELNRSISSVRDELFTVKAELKGDIADVRKEISESKADTIKWMFIFWIGQVAATLAIILLYVKK